MSVWELFFESFYKMKTGLSFEIVVETVFIESVSNHLLKTLNTFWEVGRLARKGQAPLPVYAYMYMKERKGNQFIMK